jgi:TRAP-type C4-dicarboxylate transport system substrate-binding protein
MLRASLIALLCLSAARAGAEPIVLRLATQAPDGTAWARDLKAFSAQVQASAGGAVQIKWYFGAVTGDERQTIERIRRGQLDGAGLAATCEALAPSIRVMRVPGVFQQRSEHSNILSRLQPRLLEEFRRSGFEVVGYGALGSDIVFTRTGVTSFEELKKKKLWVWDLDPVMSAATAAMGMSTLPMPVEGVRPSLENGKLDGILAVPSAALAFQWTTQVKYFIPLPINSLPACLVIATRVFDKLPLVSRDALRDAGARTTNRFTRDGDALDAALLNGLFEKQGLVKLPVTESIRAGFFQSASHARDQISDQVVPRALLEEVLAWLADYRAEHGH